MNNLRILIVEDEVLIAEDLKDTLVTFGVKEVAMAHDKADALKELEAFNPDVVLLDIRMEKETDGIEIGEYISKNYQKPFIYITAHSDVEMIKKIVKTKPLAYITKPIKRSDLFASISLAQEHLKEQPSANLQIKDGFSTLVIPIDTILYIESEGNYINIYCDKKRHIARQSLDSVLSELSGNQFFRIHRSYLVNVSRIKGFSKKEVILENISLPVSRGLADDFVAFMGARG